MKYSKFLQNWYHSALPRLFCRNVKIWVYIQAAAAKRMCKIEKKSFLTSWEPSFWENVKLADHEKVETITIFPQMLYSSHRHLKNWREKFFHISRAIIFRKCKTCRSWKSGNHNNFCTNVIFRPGKYVKLTRRVLLHLRIHQKSTKANLKCAEEWNVVTLVEL